MVCQEECEEGSGHTLAQALCMACGLCCDGTLFAFAVIAPDEDVTRLERAGITTIHGDGKTFALPCRSFDRVCTIYQGSKAKVCGEYVCELLQRHGVGTISYEQAREIIRQAKTQKEKTLSSFSAIYGATESTLEQQYEGLMKSGTELKSGLHHVAKLNFLALQLQLDRHFRRLGEAVTPKPVCISAKLA